MNAAAPSLEECLQQTFGMNSFRRGQREVVEAVLRGEDVMVVMPTGAGKSLCYQLPASLGEGVTIVVSPLIALMKDQVDALMAAERVRATYVNSTVSADERRRRCEAMQRGEWQMVYVAPERFRSQDFMAALSGTRVELFVVDEAHCISEWGHDFRTDYLRLGRAIEACGRPPVMALTATATPRVQDDIEKQLGVGALRRIVTGFDRPNLSWEVLYAANEEDKLRHLAELLNATEGSGLVYVGTRREAEELAVFCQDVLSKPVGRYHGGLDEAQRTAAHHSFRTGETPVFVATKAFGLGIDKADIRFVIHYTVPDSIESYYQEAGRAGRDGLPARCVLIYLPDDRALQEYFIRREEERPVWCGSLMDSLEEVVQNGRVRASIEAIQNRLGLHLENIDVAIRSLQRAGVLSVEEDGNVFDFRLLGPLQARHLRAIEKETRRHLNQKRRQLEALIRYAERDGCRRRALLRYFGDKPHEPPVATCCDNCLQGQPPAAGDSTPETTDIAHHILRAVAAARPQVGRGKLVKILSGSQAKELQRSGGRRNPAYGALSGYRQKTIDLLVLQLLRQDLLKTVGGEYPVIRIAPRGKSALREKWPVPLDMPRARPPSGGGKTAPSRHRGQSLEETERLHHQGLSAGEIAEQRGLSPATVWRHLAQLTLEGRVQASQLIPADVLQRVRKAAEEMGVERLKPIFEALDETVPYEWIRVVANDLRRETAGAATAHAEHEDAISRFARGEHPVPLEGDFDAGWALGHTAHFVGDVYVRTPIGELIHEFKYRGRLDLADELAERMHSFLAARPEYSVIDLIVPIPPTEARAGFQPVIELCRRLSQRLPTPAGLETLSWRRQRQLQKDMTGPVQKRRNIANALQAGPEASGKSVLLVDDFCDSGETLREAARALRQAGAARVLALTLGKTIHH